MRPLVAVVSVALALASLAACGGDDAADGDVEAAACEPVGDLADADTTVDVQLSEYLIGPEPAEAPGGMVGFDLSNDGGVAHELVVVQTDTAPGELPTDEDGAVVEEDVDGEVIGEIEPFPAQSTCEGVFDLEPGSYALVCNIVEEQGGEVISHYAEGMYSGFTITG